MRSAVSPGFRRLCLALALLATSWSIPESAHADAYALTTAKSIADTLKPNVLIVLETAESMQDLPGEDGARYNEVGADCEEGNRQCRLVGQVGRWSFSGMGSKGMYFGDPNASCTRTVTQTITVTQTAPVTNTWTDTRVQTSTAQSTGTGTSTSTSTQTATTTSTGTGSLTITATSVGTATVTTTATQTVSGTGTATRTASGTGTATGTVTQTGTATRTSTATGTTTGTTTGTSTGTQTNTNTSTTSATGTATTTATGTGSSTATKTQVNTSTTTTTFTGSKTWTNDTLWTWTGSAVRTQIANTTATGTMGGNTPNGNYTMTGTTTGSTLTATDTAGFTMTYAGTETATVLIYSNGTNLTFTWTDTGANTRTVTGTGTWIETTGAPSGTWTGTSTFAASHTNTSLGTGTITNTFGTTNTTTTTNTSTTTNTQTSTTTATNTRTSTNTATNTNTNTTTDTQTTTTTTTTTGTQTNTGTNTSTVTHTNTGTNTSTLTNTTTVTNTSSGTNTSTTTNTRTATSTTTTTNTAVATSTDTVTVTNSNTGTTTQTATDTSTSAQAYACGSSAATDPLACKVDVPTTNGFCNESGGISCAVSSTCTSPIRGDFCRAISTIDGSGRKRDESCVAAPGPHWGSCKHGVVTKNTICASSTDVSCNSTLPGDFCTEGQPAKMCADSGLWCADDPDCPGTSGTDTCSPASSRMMISKRALRRALSEHAPKVNFGFMSTYQGKGVGSTNVETEIFPYVKLQSCSGLTTITETKFLSRGELERANCFSLSQGPSGTCTIDYGGNGAVNGSSAAALNRVSYTLVTSADSRWGIPRGDGSGKSNHLDTSWSSCPSATILPACEFAGQGTGIYEGSYYTFSYSQGTPIASGEGSRATPVYFATYKGKYYTSGGSCYNAVDADRTDIVNDGIYNRVAYTGTPYDPANEVPVPWSGSTSSSTCAASTGAIWHSNVVPFLTDTTFGGQAITRDQKTLMTMARLEKASFGGLDATGKLTPLGCALQNDGAPDLNHSAAAYVAAAQDNDARANHDQVPCWTNNIVLVVDGQSSGPGDMGAATDCDSTACVYDAATNPTLAGCNCAAIVKAYSLAHSAKPVQTHVVVNAPASWSARYRYSYGFLVNLAIAGSPNFDGTPSFGTTEDEVYEAISDKIAAAAYHFPYTTTAGVAGSNTQDPNTLVVTPSNFLYDTSVSYPAWKGTVRAFDTTSMVDLKWDAVTVGASGHPSDWTKRRVFFSDRTGAIVQVQVSDTGSITNATTLHSAGLGASDAEAEHIMQWLLGKPELKNPAPLMGSVTSSTPIVVGQAASNGLNGSSQYSTATWKRPQLVYVGGDDGMLHAFFGHVGSRNLAGTSYEGGEEAFAFIPNDMLQTITKQYAQGGQKLSVDKADHIFGLAGSPKVKDMCIGSTCDQSTGSDWHTVLVMPEGPGGNKPFALDITNVIDAISGLRPSQMKLLWSTAPVASGSTSGVKLPASSDGTKWDQSLGESVSVPAFYFAGYAVGAADNRVVFASGYPVTSGTGYASQGLVILNADAATGAVKDTRDISAISAASCNQKRAVMSDVSLARDYSSLSTSQSLLAGYVTDTWGNTYQYVPTAADPRGLTSLYARTCKQPLYFAPAVVQLDRAPKADTSAKHFIYLAQVTSSNLDPITQPVSTDYPPSEIIVTKLDGNVSPPIIVSSYNPLDSVGQIVLTLDPNAPATNRICLQTKNSTGTYDAFSANKTKTQSCADVGAVEMPSTARPVATPTAILRSDGLGFQVVTSWYDPVTSNNCSAGGQFNYGKSYVTVHEFGADGTWYQIAGVTLDGTVLTGVTFIGAGLFVDGIGANAAPQSINLGETFSLAQQLLNNSASERYSRTSWTERLDL